MTEDLFSSAVGAAGWANEPGSTTRKPRALKLPKLPKPPKAKRIPKPKQLKLPKPPPEPVVLKPYVARPLIQYEIATLDELVAGAGGTMVFDTECFSNFFMIAFKNIETRKVTILTAPFEKDWLRWIMHSYTCVGFNSVKYDMPMVWAAYGNQNMERLKEVSNDLIDGYLRPGEVTEKYNIRIQPTRHIDLIEVCPLRGSLKLYGARLHTERIQDVPWAGEQALTDEQRLITENYCINDLNITELLFNNLEEQLELRTGLSKEYAQDLMSKSDAQLAETVIRSELMRLTKRKPPWPKVHVGAVHKFVTPENLFFEHAETKKALQIVTDADFVISDKGYLIEPTEIKKLKVEGIGDGVYRMGIGGLHSSEKSVSFFSDDENDLVDRDVAGYYPRIILNLQLAPQSLKKAFSIVYQGLVDRRLKAKKAGDLAVSENLKVAVNGTFGKTGSPYSVLYAPEVTLQVTMCGQLYLLMLIERMEAAGIPVMSANTDGILMRCPKDKNDVMLAVIKKWEKDTGFETEETRYKAVYARDVNAYLAIKLNDKLKGKNVLSDPWRTYDATAKDKFWRFQKNPSSQIIVEAIERFIVHAVPFEQTITGCTDITRFVCVKNVTGGAHWHGYYLGKVVRWFYAKGATGTLNYIKNNHIVPDSEGAVPMMDLPETFPDNIDYAWYIQRAEKMLKNIGYRK